MKQLLHHSQPGAAGPHTSRLRANPERGVLAILRSLAPRRTLRPAEAEYIAEIQAYRLLELAGLWEPPVPTALIAELPRIAVRQDVDLPVSGTTGWLNGRWLITLNASEVLQRQRFTLAHEFKHVIDHPRRAVLYADCYGTSAEAQEERVAEHFAACLLMPKRWVKRAWGDGHQRISDLSALFDVSPQAMRVRLTVLGLVDSAGRCDQRHDDLPRPTYRRLPAYVGGRSA